MSKEIAQNDAGLRHAMRAVAEGNTEAFRVIAEALQPRLERFYAQLGVPEAERQDLFQESCLRLYRAAKSYDPSRPFMPWALTVARRVMLNWHRAVKPTVALDEIEDTPDPRAIVAHGQRDVWDFARAHLTADAYELLWLCYGEDMGPAEIAHVTGRSAVHVRVLLYRARHALGHELEKAGELLFN